MSRTRNDSCSEGEGIPIENVEFTTSTTPDNDADDVQARWLMQQQQQQHQIHHHNNNMYHARNASGSSLDTEAAAEYWHQWQQYYAAYGYSYQPPAGYQGYSQQQQQPQSQSQQQQQQPFLLPPQSQQQYAPWPAHTAPNTYAAPVSLGSKQQQSTSPHSQGSSLYPQSRKSSNSAPTSPKFSPSRAPPLSQENYGGTMVDGDTANDVYAALLQGVGPTYGATAQPSHHRKNGSRGSLPDSVGPRSSTGSSKLFDQQPPQPPRRSNVNDEHPSHQRSKSDSLFSLNNRKKQQQQPYHLQRSNTSGVPTDPLRRPRANSRSNSRSHRRTSSYASSGGVSVSSMVSIVSDIRKSTFYAPHHNHTEHHTKGRVQLHFPTSFVHLVPSRSRKLRLYQVPVSNEQYEAYHRVADESFSWIGDDEDGDVGDDDDLEKNPPVEVDIADLELLTYPTTIVSSPPKQQLPKRKSCTCHCPNCATCQHKMKSALDPSYFLLTVPDNLYRSVVDEICAAREMPCGLFFCGHHEDVSRPSIGIAGAIVLLLFAAMAYAAYVLQA